MIQSMKKYVRVKFSLWLVMFMTATTMGFSQDNFYFSQYFQVGPAINPALTGIDNFLDIKFNYRNQWAGLNDSPSTNYLGVNGYINKNKGLTYRDYALRISNPNILDSLSVIKSSLKNKLKHGIGGHIIYDRQGPFSQVGGYFNYALHIPIGFKTYLSVGASVSLTNKRIDLSKIRLRDPDNWYDEQLVAQGGRNTYLDINPGFAVYSEKWYVAYAAFKAYRKALSTDEVLDYNDLVEHNLLLGLRLNLSSRTKLLPSVYYNYSSEVSSTWETSVKMMFNEKPWFGVSYRSTKAVVFMAGVYINNRFNVSYSYDYTLSNLSNYNNGSHEVHFGLMLNKKDLKSPYLW